MILCCWPSDPRVATCMRVRIIAHRLACTKPHPLFMHAWILSRPMKQRVSGRVTRGSHTERHTHRPFQRAFWGCRWKKLTPRLSLCDGYSSSPIGGHETKHGWNNRTLPENITKSMLQHATASMYLSKKPYGVLQGSNNSPQESTHTTHTPVLLARKLTCYTQ